MPRLTLTGTNIDAPDANALADFYRRASTVQVSILRQREPGQWYLLVKGVATYNCYGDPIDACRAGRIAWAFRPPSASPRPTRRGSTTMQGFCHYCDAPFATGTGTCPSPDTATALAATARAWTRTGRR